MRTPRLSLTDTELRVFLRIARRIWPWDPAGGLNHSIVSNAVNRLRRKRVVEHAVVGSGREWSLTPLGERYLAFVRRQR